MFTTQLRTIKNVNADFDKYPPPDTLETSNKKIKESFQN